MFIGFLSSLLLFVLIYNQQFFRCVNAGISAQKCQEYDNYDFLKNKVTNEYDCVHSASLVAGGVAVKDHEFPHFALLGYEIDDDEIVFACGGSLISERFILSAAHCEIYEDFIVSYVRLGEHTLGTRNRYRKNYAVEKFTAHQEYNPQTKINDIALIKLDRNVNINKGVRPACLHQNAGMILMGENVTAIGFGDTGYAADSSNTLLKVELTVVRPNLCLNVTKGVPLNMQICVKGQGDTCNGDSGGPIQKTRTKCTFDLYGITSYGGPCNFGAGAVYTRISSYIPWIENIVWK